MPWLKVSDLFPSHPMLMRLVGARGADDRTINEVTGFVVRLGAGAAAHMTDYRVDLGTATMYGQGRTEQLLRQAVEVGLMSVEGRGKNRRWLIVEDDDLIHMRTKAEIEWERLRKRDVSNKQLTLAVRLRDGDACRYCSKPVNWNDRRGNRGGTYDHVIPGKAATLETFVVACKPCNSSLGDMDREARAERLQPAPEHPFYQPKTIEMLVEHGLMIPGTARPTPPGEDTAATARPETKDTDAHPARGSSPTAATARGTSTDEPTAATPVRDPHPRTPQPPRRDSGTPARTPQPPARPTPPGEDTAATTGSDFAQRMEDPPPPWLSEPQPEPPADLQKPASPGRKQVSGPGRVGKGSDGTGGDQPPARHGPDLLDPAGSPAPSSSRRGRRARKSKGR